MNHPPLRDPDTSRGAVALRYQDPSADAIQSRLSQHFAKRKLTEVIFTDAEKRSVPSETISDFIDGRVSRPTRRAYLVPGRHASS
jgi:hypothetical protein